MNPEFRPFVPVPYERIVESIGVGLIYVDNQDVIHYVNAVLCGQLGYRPEELLGKVAFDVLLDARGAELMRKKILNRQEGISDNYEIPMRDKQGRERMYSISGYPVKDKDGKVTGSVGLYIDIHDEQKIRKDLVAAETKCHSVLQSARDAIMVCNEAGEIIFWNECAVSLFGYPPETSGKAGDIIIAPPAEETVKQIIRSMMQDTHRTQKGHTSEFIAKRKNGIEFPAELSTSSWKTEDETFYSGIIRDVSEQTQMRQRLENTNEQLNTLITSMQEMFISHDMILNKPLFISPSCEEVYGYSQEEFYNKPSLWFDVIHPDDKPKVKQHMESQHGGESFVREYRIIKKDGSVHWVEARLRPTLKNGSVARVDGSVIDISKRKIAEQRLEQKVNELNIFTYKASHDLRSPLNSLVGLVNLATLETKDESLNTYFRMIKESTQKMDAIIQDLMMVATVTQGEVKSSSIDFRQLIEETLASIKFLPGFEEISISTDLQLKKEFHSDRRYLASVLSNLISNAVKYRDPKKESFLRIRISETEKGVQISIADNGIGIPTALQEKVFDMFYRATEFSSGSGLGLYIVRTTLEKLHGSIEMKSEEMTGTTFTVYLPDLVA